jgi:hypothetical protein
MQTSQANEAPAVEVRKDASAVLGAVSSAVNPSKVGMGQKIAIAATLYRLARRYPVPALIIGGIAVALYMARGRRDTTATRTYTH